MSGRRDEGRRGEGFSVGNGDGMSQRAGKIEVLVRFGIEGERAHQTR